MANDEDLARLWEGAAVWNDWRAQNRECCVSLSGANLSLAELSGANLSEANLSGANLSGANLSWANLSSAALSETNLSAAILAGANLSSGAYLPGANLSRAILVGAKLPWANLSEANLSGANLGKATWANLSGANIGDLTDLPGANLSGAILVGANLSETKLSGANLSEANLSGANLSGANLSEANLSGANLESATLIGTNLTGADLTGCRVYGISAWALRLEGTKQRDLVITPPNQPEITVDNLEVAQFIYLLINNKKIRDVIDTITSKVVLILGRFTKERKEVLDALREELRKSERNYVPIVFDFEKPASKDLTGTVSTLARMARFIIADLTDPRCIPHELAFVVPTNTKVPVQPVILLGETAYTMFDDLRAYSWVLQPYHYETPEQLIADLGERVIGPAEAKVRELRG